MDHMLLWEDDTVKVLIKANPNFPAESEKRYYVEVEQKPESEHFLKFDKEMEHWVLWEDGDIRVVIQRKTNFPAEFGGHIVVEQKLGLKTPYDNYPLFAKMSIAAAAVQRGLEEIGLAPHANIQSNANWAFRESNSSFRDVKGGRKRRKLHIHVYGRTLKDPGWAEPIRPAYHQEQQQGKYWGKVFSPKEMRALSEFLKKELLTAI